MSLCCMICIFVCCCGCCFGGYQYQERWNQQGDPGVYRNEDPNMQEMRPIYDNNGVIIGQGPANYLNGYEDDHHHNCGDNRIPPPQNLNPYQTNLASPYSHEERPMGPGLYAQPTYGSPQVFGGYQPPHNEQDRMTGPPMHGFAGATPDLPPDFFKVNKAVNVAQGDEEANFKGVNYPSKVESTWASTIVKDGNDKKIDESMVITAKPSN